MSEYTPSTDEVRGAWIALTYNNTPEEFDRWLAEHDRKVKAEAWEEGKEYGDKRANREIPF